MKAVSPHGPSRPTSIYENLRETMRESLIVPGQIGDRVPSERQLAQQFGVSPVTVSRALQELQNEGVIQRVPGKGTFIRQAPPTQIAAQSSNGQGNSALPWLSKNGHSIPVGAVASNTLILAQLSVEPSVHARDYWSQRATSSVERALQGAGGQTRVANCLGVAAAEVQTRIKALMSEGINAVVFVDDDAGSGAETEAWTDALIGLRCGAFGREVAVTQILFGGANRHPTDVVRFDGAWGTHLAVQHLLRLGHQRIAFLAPAPRMRWIEERSEAFCAALRSAGVRDAEALVVNSDVAMSEAPDSWGQISRDVADKFFALNGITAIVAANDQIAQHFLDAANTRGRAVPDELSVVGFDDQRTSNLLGLTTLHVPVEEMGEVAAELIARRLQEPFEAGRLEVVLNPTLVVRSSTRAWAAP